MSRKLESRVLAMTVADIPYSVGDKVKLVSNALKPEMKAGDIGTVTYIDNRFTIAHTTVDDKHTTEWYRFEAVVDEANE